MLVMTEILMQSVYRSVKHHVHIVPGVRESNPQPKGSNSDGETVSTVSDYCLTL